MKILLIETSRTYHDKSKGVRLSLPLGLLYMGAVLEEEGFEVSSQKSNVDGSIELVVSRWDP